MSQRPSKQKKSRDGAGGKRQVQTPAPAAAISKEKKERRAKAMAGAVGHTAATPPATAAPQPATAAPPTAAAGIATAAATAASKRSAEFPTSSRTNVKKRKEQMFRSAGKSRRNNAVEGVEVDTAFSSALQDILGTAADGVEGAEIAAVSPSSFSSAAYSSVSFSSSSSKKSAAAAASPLSAAAAGGRREEKTRAAVLRDRPGIFTSLARTQQAWASERKALLERRKRREASHETSLAAAADVEHERELRTLATKGMVRFLNAVMKFRRQQAKGKRDFKKEKQRRFQMRKKRRAFRKTS